MITTKTKEAALKLFLRIESSAAPIGVFIHKTDKSVKATKITTDLFREALRSSAMTLMGVYNNECHLAWLEDDLGYCGVN